MAWNLPMTWTTSTALSASRLNERLRDNMDYLKTLADSHRTQHAKNGSDILYYKRQLVWDEAGTLSTGTKKSRQWRYRGPTGTIVRADALVESVASGADIIIDINIDGSSIWGTNPGNRLTIPAGVLSAVQSNFDTTEIGESDIITTDIGQVGSGTPGADLTVLLGISCPVETSWWCCRVHAAAQQKRPAPVAPRTLRLPRRCRGLWGCSRSAAFGLSGDLATVCRVCLLEP